MLRKLVIIGSIAALFVLTAAPAFGITLNGPDGVPSRRPSARSLRLFRPNPARANGRARLSPDSRGLRDDDARVSRRAGRGCNARYG